MLSATDLGSLDDAALEALLARGVPLGHGIGGPTVRLDLADRPLFVKRVPLTDVELAHPRSTANLFALPMVYQYGVGSLGFNAWRELAAHECTTTYVRGSGLACFPVLQHFRVLPRVPARPLDAEYTRWDGLTAVRDRLLAVEQATSSLVLFLEYVPGTFCAWWAQQDAEATVERVEVQLLEIAEVLRANGLLHLDSHAANLLHDPVLDRLLVTDFGLVTSAEFDLDADEREFVARHGGHDRAFLMTQLVNGLVRRLVPGADQPAARNAWIAGPRTGTELSPKVRDLVERWVPVARLVNAFYWQLHAGNLQTPYPYEAIDAAVERAAV